MYTSIDNRTWRVCDNSYRRKVRAKSSHEAATLFLLANGFDNFSARTDYVGEENGVELYRRGANHRIAVEQVYSHYPPPRGEPEERRNER